MKKNLLIIFVLQSFFSLGQQLTKAESEQFKAKVIEKNKFVESIQSDFQQKKHLDFMSKDIETFGKMAFLKPNSLNWQYTNPYKYRIVFQNDKISINDAGSVSQIKTDNKVFKKINHLIISSVTGDMFKEKDFQITYWKSKEKILVKLIPKDKTLVKYINEIHLYFADNATVERVKLIEPSNDYTEIIFTNTKINATINEATFSM